MRHRFRRPGEAAKAEEQDYKQARRRLELTSLTQDLDERKKYAKLIFVLACAWLAAVLWIIVLQGFGGVPGSVDKPFRLTDSVLLALMGTTTVNVLGTLYIVANYLFPKKLTLAERAENE